MAKTLELVIRDGGTILFTAAAKVDDDFEDQLFAAYREHYPDTPDDETLFYQLAQGIFEGVANNIRMTLQARPPRPPKAQFEIVGDEVVTLGESDER